MANNKKLSRQARLSRMALTTALASILIGTPGLALAQNMNVDYEFISLNESGVLSFIDGFRDADNDVNALAAEGPDTDRYPDYDEYNDMNVDITFSGNIDLSGGSSGESALVFNGNNGKERDDPEYLERGFNKFTIKGGDGNSRSTLNGGVANSSSTTSSGTLLYISGVKDSISISNTNFINSKATSVEQEVNSSYGGAGIIINPNYLDSSGVSWHDVTLTNVTLRNNNSEGKDRQSSVGGGLTILNSASQLNDTVNLNNVDVIGNSLKTGTFGSAAASNFLTYARGGGVAIDQVANVDIINGTYQGNSILLYSGSSAAGGGLSIESYGKAQNTEINLNGAGFINNKVEMIGTNSSSTFAGGGGFSGEARGAHGNTSPTYSTTVDFKNSLFQGNKVRLENSSGYSANAYGGGAAMFGNLNATFEKTSFVNNSVTVTGYGNAYGGAVYTERGVTISGGVLSGNSATAGAGGAYGGAVYTGSSLTIKDGSLQNNSVTSNSGQAHGGAVFMDASVNTGAINLNLEAAAKDFIISGNTANGKSSGIYIGNHQGSTSTSDVTLNLTGSKNFSMLDSLTVGMNGGREFNMNRSNSGLFTWQGRHNIKASSVNLKFSNGLTHVDRDFSVNITGNTGGGLEFANGSGFIFDSRRDGSLAFFNNEGGQLQATTNGTVTMGISDTRRQLTDFSKRYVFAAKTDGNLSSIGFGENLSGTFSQDGGNIIFDMHYSSPYKSAIQNAGKNTSGAASSLNELIQDQRISDEMVEYIHASLRNVTPEAAAVSGSVGLTTTARVARTALKTGLTRDHNYTLYTPVAAQPSYGEANEGGRMFASLLGNTRSVDSDKGYYGYDQDTTGVVIGGAYDNGYLSSIGGYFGYTKADTEFDKAKASSESEGIHLGVIGRYSPEGNADPSFSFYGDAGYSHYTVDTRRRVGGNVKGDFKQNAFTVGLGTEYVNHLDYSTRFTPSLDLRYTKLEQDSFKEKGLTATEVDSMEVDSLTSNLAVTLSHEVPLNDGVLTPMVRVGWQHEFGDLEHETKAAYMNQSGGLIPGKFNIGSVATDRDSFDGGLGLRAVFNSGSYGQMGLNLNYDLNVSKNSNTHTISGGFEYRF